MYTKLSMSDLPLFFNKSVHKELRISSSFKAANTAALWQRMRMVEAFKMQLEPIVEELERLKKIGPPLGQAQENPFWLIAISEIRAKINVLESLIKLWE